MLGKKKVPYPRVFFDKDLKKALSLVQQGYILLV